MEVSTNVLRRDTVQLIQEIETQINEVKAEAQTMGIPPEKLRDANANWVMSPLLMAKAQAYNTLVLLNPK